MKAKAYFEPRWVPSEDWHYEGNVFCDDCPDPCRKPSFEKALGEAYVQGYCWDSEFSEDKCPHFRGMEMDDDHQLWIRCDSRGWAADP